MQIEALGKVIHMYESKRDIDLINKTYDIAMAEDFFKALVEENEKK